MVRISIYANTRFEKNAYILSVCAIVLPLYYLLVWCLYFVVENVGYIFTHL